MDVHQHLTVKLKRKELEMLKSSGYESYGTTSPSFRGMRTSSRKPVICRFMGRLLQIIAFQVLLTLEGVVAKAMEKSCLNLEYHFAPAVP